MTEMNVVVVDNEPLLCRTLSRLCRSFPEVAGVQNFDDGDDAIAYILQHRVELVFLDTGLPGDMALLLAERITRLSRPVQLAFVSPDDGYAYQAFRYNAVGYVLKPYLDEQIHAVVRKAAALPSPAPL